MARRRKRRKLKTGVILWALVIVNVALGLAFSPITAATRIRVVGAKPSDAERISKELQWLRDKPCLAVNGLSVEEQILRRPDVKSTELSRNIFGRGQLVVTYYEPVALVDGTKNTVLTDGGFLCQMPDVPEGLPTLKLFPDCARPSLGMSTSWEPARIADVCLRAVQQGIVKNLSITVTVGGLVCLNSGETGRIVLGSPYDLDEKFGKIQTILASQPDLLAQGKELVLIAPSKPVTRPLQPIL